MISLRPKRLLKTHIFEKQKAIFPAEKIVWHIFSRTIDHDKRHKTTYMDPQGYLTFTVEGIRSFL